jgi:hypothetical protein
VKTKVRRRLKSFNALYVFSPTVYFRVRRGPLYHDDCVYSVQEKQGKKRGVWVPVSFDTMTRGGEDTALHIINYSE